MTFAKSLPRMDVKPQVVGLTGGLDVTSTASTAKPGTLQFSLNYESHVDGGYERLGGIERFDGRPRPSDAQVLVMAPATTFSGSFAVGDTLNGQTSGATGKVIYISAAYIALTKVTGTFQRLENIRKVTTVLGVYASTDPTITALQDNALAALAANEYRLDVLAVPGSGRIRGCEVLNGVVYAWRDNVGGTAMNIYKSTAAGWVQVPMYHEVPFDTGTAAYTEGSTLSKGGNTATVKRVVLESGSWAGGTAKGTLVITAPTPSAFTAGVAAGGGAATLTAGSSVIVLNTGSSPAPRVETKVYNFTGAAGQFRIYGCDKLNREFEFDGDVLAPINTGMGSVRASHVFCHKQFLFFSYLGSLQHSSVGFPYQWSPIVGAGELGMGDTITGMTSVSGSEASAAMLVFCKNRSTVLYGSGPATWNPVPLSEEAGAAEYGMQDIGRTMAYDTPGFRMWSPTQSFGNFVWDLASSRVEPVVRNKAVLCSALVKSKGRYRCFFTDGTAISGTPRGKTVDWMPIDYGRTIVVAAQGEIDNISRVFYGDTNGFILEADVGRSLDGAPLNAAIKPHGLIQGSTIVNKQYRRVDIEGQGDSAFTMSYGFEFNDGDPNAAPTSIVPLTSLGYAGRSLFWDGANWDQAYWDGSDLARQRLPSVGQGYSIAPIFSVNSDSELPHKLNVLTVVYSPLRMLR